MQRVATTFLAVFLFGTSLAAAVGQVEICIGDDHVTLAPPSGHHLEAPDCCGHAHKCTDIIVEGLDHSAPMACDATEQPALTHETSVAPTPQHPRSMRCVLPERPPPIGLTLVRCTVLRI